MMEHAVNQHGKIRAYNYEPARLYIETDAATIESFKKSHPSWIVIEEIKLDPRDIRPVPTEDLASQRAARKREWRSHGLG